MEEGRGWETGGGKGEGGRRKEVGKGRRKLLGCRAKFNRQPAEGEDQ